MEILNVIKIVRFGGKWTFLTFTFSLSWVGDESERGQKSPGVLLHSIPYITVSETILALLRAAMVNQNEIMFEFS